MQICAARAQTNEGSHRYEHSHLCRAQLRRDTFSGIRKAVTHPNHAVVCEQNIDELRRVFNRKFPTKLYAMERFLATALMSIEVVPVPEPETDAEQSVRDVADRPILRAAIASGVDVLLTGDKDFLESGTSTRK